MHPLTEIIANNPDEFAHRILLVASKTVIARNVFHIDWGMPGDLRQRLRAVTDEWGIRGLRPVEGYGGDTLWLGPHALHIRFTREAITYARAAGFKVKEYTEFKTYADAGIPRQI